MEDWRFKYFNMKLPKKGDIFSKNSFKEGDVVIVIDNARVFKGRRDRFLTKNKIGKIVSSGFESSYVLFDEEIEIEKIGKIKYPLRIPNDLIEIFEEDNDDFERDFIDEEYNYNEKEFEVGDRVIVDINLKHTTLDPYKDSVGTIEKIDGGDFPYLVKFDNERVNSIMMKITSCYFNKTELKLINEEPNDDQEFELDFLDEGLFNKKKKNKFKVGDRVIGIDEKGLVYGYGDENMFGKIGTVTSIKIRSDFMEMGIDTKVYFDNTEKDVYCSSNQLELYKEEPEDDEQFERDDDIYEEYNYKTKQFEYGDRVISLRNDRTNNKKGIIRAKISPWEDTSKYPPNYLVEFEEKNIGYHNGDGVWDDWTEQEIGYEEGHGNCMWINEKDLKLIKPEPEDDNQFEYGFEHEKINYKNMKTFENILSFEQFSKIYEDGEGGGSGDAAAGGGGTAYSTLSNTGGMGDVVASQVSNTPGDVAGSTKGSGDLANVGYKQKRKKKLVYTKGKI